MFDLGKVLKPQGIKGEIKLEPMSDPEFFRAVAHVFVDGVEYNIVSARVHEGFVYLRLSGIDTRDQAEELRDKVVSVPKEELPALKEGQFFYEDLIDCSLYNDKDKKLGDIVGIENYGSADLLEIHFEGQFGSTLCPYVDGLFSSVDIPSKKIVVNEKRLKELV